MHCRLFFVIFLFLYAGLGNADTPAWNCEKDKAGEWSCVEQPSSSLADNEKKLDSIPADSKAEKPASLSEANSAPILVKKQQSTNELVEQSEPVISKKAEEGEPVESELISGQSISISDSKPERLPVSVPVNITVENESKTPEDFEQAPQSVAKRPGWTCLSNEGNETWSCSLMGADPKGQAKVIEQGNTSDGLINTAFNFDQEQIFGTLHTELEFDPWKNCTASSPASGKYIPLKDTRNTAPMSVNADYSEVYDKEITSFFGNVEITRADQKVFSDMASYDTVSETMDAQGHVFYSENQISLYSDTVLLNLGTDEARLRNALFISPSGPIRGKAGVVYRDSKILSRYKDVAFTSCPPGNQDWVIQADRLKMNKQTGMGAVKNAWLEIKGLPVIYTPYLSFPLDDRRLSGLLPPSLGSNDENGFDLLVPYYFNIAPNYDLSVWGRYMSRRGGMVGGDFRYLTEMSEGSLGLELLPYDQLRDEPRFSGTFRNRTQFTSDIHSNIDLNIVSDEEYFDELNNALGLSNDRYLKSYADLTYNTTGISFITRLETFQTIDNDVLDINKPYQTLPQVALNLEHSFEDWPLDLAMENEYIHFFRNGRVTGHRFNVKPSIAAPVQTAGAFLKPKISLQYSQYILTDQPEDKSENISRALPIFSVDSGLFFERDLNLFDSGFLHTLEPRLFYLFIPTDDQKDIPVFDTALYDFSFNSLFRENRFSGTDRIQDANQITMALTSRLIDSETGVERLKFSLGEIFYFQDREVTLSGSPETNSFSNVVAELNGQLSKHLSFTSGVQWNPDANDFTRAQAELRYRNQAEQIINLGYRYRRDNPDSAASIIQTDASFRWPIYDNWYGVGRWQYSLKFNSTAESFLGVEKESCCWRLRFIWRRYANTLSDSSNNEMDEGIFVQVELKGLTDFGDKVDSFLEKNLKGYQKADY